MSWDKEHWSYKCSDGEHNSFWKTVVTSPQWKAWEKHVHNNFHKACVAFDKGNVEAYKKADVWDVDECQECNWISEHHFQSFIRFIRKTKI